MTALLLCVVVVCGSPSPSDMDATPGYTAFGNDTGLVGDALATDAIATDAKASILAQLPPYDHLGATFRYRVNGSVVNGSRVSLARFIATSNCTW